MPDTQELPVTPLSSRRTTPLITRFGRLTGPQRAGLIAALILIAGGLAWGFRPRESEYATLVRAVDLTDVSDITKTLKEQKIAYRLEDEGTTILVPRESIYETRIVIAGKGLPHNGATGFELFDRNNLAVSEFSERVSWQRALQGELARTIQEIDSVEHARVHLTLPQDEVFAESRKTASAAVTLRVARGRDLSAENAAAVVALVSRSVPGLDGDHVSVVNQHGRVLWNPSADARKRHAEDDITERIQHTLEERVATLLAPLVGEDRCQVRVAADLDLSEKDVQTNRILRDSSAPKSRQISEEKYSAGKARTPTPAPSTDALAPSPNPSSDYGRHNETTTYEVGTETEHDVTPGGRIRRLNVAVLLDEEAARALSIVRIETLVGEAVGLDRARGDKLTVQTMPFRARASADDAAAPTPVPSPAATPSIVPLAGLAAVAAVAALLVPLALVRRRTPPPANLTRLEPRTDPARTAALLKSWMNTEDPPHA